MFLFPSPFLPFDNRKSLLWMATGADSLLSLFFFCLRLDLVVCLPEPFFGHTSKGGLTQAPGLVQRTISALSSQYSKKSEYAGVYYRSGRWPAKKGVPCSGTCWQLCAAERIFGVGNNGHDSKPQGVAHEKVN